MSVRIVRKGTSIKAMLSLSMDEVLQARRMSPDDASFGVAAITTSYPPQSWCGGCNIALEGMKMAH